LQKTPGTIGLYDFTIDTGRYAIDRSGHGNHGIIVGANTLRPGEIRFFPGLWPLLAPSDLASTQAAYHYSK
jgi:hypothetical protein